MATSPGRRKSRPLLPLEDPVTDSLVVAHRWLTIYEQREALLQQTQDGIEQARTGYVEAIARGAAFWRRRVLELADLDIDHERKMLRGRNGLEIPLSRREMELLLFLAAHIGRSFPDHVLAARAWGGRLSGDQARIYVRRLRSKLATSGWRLASRRGYGYTLERDLNPTAAWKDPRPEVTAAKVEEAVGRAYALLTAQRVQIDTAVAIARRLREVARRNGRNGGRPLVEGGD